MGAILGGADDREIEQLRAVGSDFGMAFQIVDDVLDLRATSEQIGKPANLDAYEFEHCANVERPLATRWHTVRPGSIGAIASRSAGGAVESA